MVLQFSVPMLFLGALLLNFGFTSEGILLFVIGTLLSLGFGPFGILAGSIASFVQSIIGNIVAGSVFAITQSLTALFWGKFLVPALAIVFILYYNGYGHLLEKNVWIY